MNALFTFLRYTGSEGAGAAAAWIAFPGSPGRNRLLGSVES